MKVGISAWSYRWLFGHGTMTYAKFLDEVKRRKADSFEIFPGFLDEERVESQVKQIAKKAKRLRLGISSLIVCNDFARPAATERAEQVERMKRFIDAAADAGVRRLNTFTGYHIDGQDPTMEYMRVIDAYREVMPLAEKRKVPLCIENHSSVCRDADSLLAIIRAVGSPALRTNPDPTNFCRGYQTGDDRMREIIYTETEKFAPLMANAHLKMGTFDAKGNAEFVDIARLIRIFRKAKYTGDLVIEYNGQGDPRESVAKGIAQLRRLLRGR